MIFALLSMPDSLLICILIVLLWTMISSNIYTRFDFEETTQPDLKVPGLNRARSLTLKLLVIWILFQVMLYAFLLFGYIGRGKIVLQQSIWSVLTSISTIIAILYLQFKYSGIPFRSPQAAKQLKRATFVAFVWSCARLVHTVLYVIREGELDNPKVIEEISDYTLPLILTVVDLVVTELMCFYFVLNSVFAKIFLPDENVAASIPLMIRAKKDSFTMEMIEKDEGDLVIHKEIYNKRGKLGVLYQGHLNGNAVIVRRITLSRVNSYVIEKLQQDVNEIRNIANPYLLSNLRTFIKKPVIDIVMPYITGGSLFSALHEKKVNFSFAEKLQIGKKIALSLKLIHSQGRVHGHLSSHNILLDSSSLYITDIGLEHLKKYAGLMGAYCNKNAWSSPEVLKETGNVVIKPTVYDDVFSFGIILWEIISEQEPFPDYSLKKLKELVGAQGYRPALSECGVEDIEELVKSCWNTDPTHRPSFNLVFSTLTNLCERE